MIGSGVINSSILLGELKTVVTKLEAHILNRCRETYAVDAALRFEFEATKGNNRRRGLRSLARRIYHAGGGLGFGGGFCGVY